MNQNWLTRNRHRCQAQLILLAVSAFLSGCSPQTPAERLIGQWHGTESAGSVLSVTDWHFNRDGTATSSLILPQGILTAQGTWTLRDGSLIRRTSIRVIVFSGQQKKVLLRNPIQSVYVCTLTDDTLLLRQPNATETISLTRDK